jgi:hypothetical protein
MPRKNDERRDSRRLSRSTKLRKYACVYKSYVRKTEQSKISKSPRCVRKPNKTTRVRRESRREKEKPEKKKKGVPKSKRKTLNAYQKFVQQESKKDKYRDIPGKQRLGAIAAAWKKVNK